MLNPSQVANRKTYQPSVDQLLPKPLAEFDVAGDARAFADEGQDEQDEEQARLAKIDALGTAIVEKRTEAVEYRQELGIEADWDEDEEFYQAIDRANPEGDTNAGAGKPMTQDGSASAERRKKTGGRSSVFIPATRSYVDAGSARVADMLLPNDDRPWSIRPTPVPDGGPAEMQQSQVAQAAGAAAGTQPMPQIPGSRPGFSEANASPLAEPLGQPDAMRMVQQAPVQLPMGVASSALSDEEKRAAAAEKRIEDWLVECQWNGEVRKVIEDAAKVGSGVLKGPFPVKRVSQKFMRDPATGQMRLQRIEQVVPISKRVNYRNFFPSADCGESHQNGSYVFEYDSIAARELRKLAQDDTYIRANIIKVLREGPSNSWSNTSTPNSAESERIRIGGTFPLWYFYGELDRDTLIAAGVPPEDLGEDDDEQVLTAVPALVIMVNDTVIKATLSPMESGGFPYDVFRWQRRDGMIWGKGVARQMRTPQRMLNGAVRAMMDNAALTAGPLWAIRKGWIVPIDGKNEMTGRKGFYMTDSAPPSAKIQDCISFTNIESNIAELQTVINMAKTFGEEATGLPMLMQGQQGEATDTATGMTILNNNGSTVLRRIARTFDDDITEPHIRRYYNFLLEAPGNDECKGDMQIDARGSTYLVERDLQAKSLIQLYPLFMQHPDVHKGRLAEEVAQASRLNFKRIMMTDAEKQAAAQQPPPEDKSVTVAKLRAASAEKIAEGRMQVDAANVQKDFELGLAKLEQDGTISSDNIKALLATTVMRLTHASGEKRQDRMHQRVSDAEARANDAVETPGLAPAHEGVSR